MVQFIPVSPEEIDSINLREGHRGRVSYPILKSFMELGEPMCQLDRTGMQQSLQSLSSSLGAYIRSHNLPIKLFMRRGQIFLARTDIDPTTGKPMALGKEVGLGPRVREQVGVAPARLLEDDSIPEIDGAEIDTRGQEEGNLTTK